MVKALVCGASNCEFESHRLHFKLKKEKEMDKEWLEKNSWVKRSDTFSVEIVHWTSKPYQDFDKDPNFEEHRWNVYLYIYPTNKLFDKIKKCNCIYDKELNLFDNLFHRGITLFSKDDFSVKIGSDYGHLYDELFKISGPYYNGKTSEPDNIVFRDAEYLYNEIEKISREL